MPRRSFMTADARLRRCHRRPGPAGPRPSRMLTVFFAPALAFLVTGAVAGVASELTDTPWLHWLMPTPDPARDRAIVVAAAVGIGALALAHIEGLEPVAAPATAVAVAVGLLLSSRIAVLALRAFGARASRRAA